MATRLTAKQAEYLNRRMGTIYRDLKDKYVPKCPDLPPEVLRLSEFEAKVRSGELEVTDAQILAASGMLINRLPFLMPGEYRWDRNEINVYDSGSESFFECLYGVVYADPIRDFYNGPYTKWREVKAKIERAIEEKHDTLMDAAFFDKKREVTDIVKEFEAFDPTTVTG